MSRLPECSAASSGDDHTAKIWEARTGQPRTTLKGHNSLVASIAYTLDGETIATSAFDGRITIWDVATGCARYTLAGHKGPVRGLAFHHESDLLASISDDRTVKLWDVARGELRGTLRGHTDKIRALVFQPSSPFLVTADNDGSLKMWDTDQGRLVKSWRHGSEIHSLATTSDGGLLAAGSKEGTIRLYRMPQGELTAVLAGATHSARSLALASGGTAGG